MHDICALYTYIKRCAERMCKSLREMYKFMYNMHKLFTCFMCLGTWMGFAISAIMIYMGYGSLTPVGSLGVENIYLMTFLNGLLSSGGVWFIHTVLEFFERAFNE